MTATVDENPSPRRPGPISAPRRLSYDHSSNPNASNSASLSLGALPAPSLTVPPPGQRSVPALERHDASTPTWSSATPTTTDFLTAPGPNPTNGTATHPTSTDTWSSSSSRTTSWTDETSPRLPSPPRQTKSSNNMRSHSFDPIEPPLVKLPSTKPPSPELDLSAGMRSLRLSNGQSDQRPNNGPQRHLAQVTGSQLPVYANSPVQSGLWSPPVYPADQQPQATYLPFYAPHFGNPGPGYGMMEFGQGPGNEMADWEARYRRDSFSPPNVVYGLPPTLSRRPSVALGWPPEISRSATRSPQQSFSPRSAYDGFNSMPDFGPMSPYASGMVAGAPHMLYSPSPILSPRNNVTRGALLEEFRLNRHRRWDVGDLRGQIVEFSGDQIGSRHIQSKLEMATPMERAQVFDELIPHLLNLSVDVFANYVIQKMIEVADVEQRTRIVVALKGNILRLSLQMYGCRVVQKALERATLDEQVELIRELDGQILKCAKDQNANHVLQRILEKVPPEQLSFIPVACQGQVFTLATHPYGCRVLQRILENMSGQDVRPLLDEFHKYSQNLIQDQYGNYVAQYVLEKGSKADKSAIISKVRGQVLHLAKHKFASNVVDKVVLSADEEERRLLTDEILFDPTAIAVMLKDQYANYPIQKFLLTVPPGAQRELLLARTADALNNLRKYSSSYSKHLMAIERWIIEKPVV